MAPSPRRHGTHALECAVVFPVVFLLLFGLLIGALGVFRYQQVASLAREYPWERRPAPEMPEPRPVQIVEPPGGHAIYIDAAAFCDHLPRSQFPGQALLCALYRHAGIRAVEIGSVMFGRSDPDTGETVFPPMELVRLAVPRRVYTQSHIDYVIEAAGEVYQRRKEIRGLRIVEAPAVLRHFTAKFEEM